MGNSTESAPATVGLPAPTASGTDGEKVVSGENKQLDSASTRDGDTNTDLEDVSEHLPTWKMAIVTLALCLAIFCMALVRRGRITPNLYEDQADPMEL